MAQNEPLVGLALGIAFVFGGAYWAYTKHEWAQHAGHADGTVIATPHGGAHPEVAYNTPEGGYQNKPMSDITYSSYDGEHVHVLYDRKQPSSAELDSWPNLYLFATIFAIGGAGVTAWSLVALRRRSRKSRRS